MFLFLSRRAVVSANMASVITLTLRPTPSLAADGQAVVTLQSGGLRGTRAGGVASFKRVPYAANPFTAASRFQAPKPVAPWEGIRDATAFGPPPLQPGRDPQSVLFGGPDDLTLNIWTPDPSAKGLPVMVWIPGGAFVRADASEPTYDGTRFAADGIVVVTVNYRVGVEGFMAIEGAPPNRGLLDQIAALRWVCDNIAAFGGDAANVTLFGQSAGAESAAILLASPKAEGLFKRVILQSPPMQAMNRSDATRLTAVFAKGLGVAPTVGGLAGVPLDRLIDAGTKLATAIKDRDTWGKLSLGGTAFLPLLDGDVLGASPIDMLARGPKPGVPVIVGSTDEESRIYMVPGGAIDHISQQAIDQFIGDLKLPADTLDIYKTNPANDTIGMSTPRCNLITRSECRHSGSPSCAAATFRRGTIIFPGGLRGSVAGSVRRISSMCRSASTPYHRTRRRPSSAPILRPRSPKPCTVPGSPSPRLAIPAGRLMT